MTEFLEKSKLGRIATSFGDLPRVVPITYEFGSWNLNKSVKFRNIRKNNRVALVVDDLVSASPWTPRGLQIRGTAEVQENNDGLFVKITPPRKVSWGPGVSGKW